MRKSRELFENWKPEADSRWKKVAGESFNWPFNNNPCKEVFEDIFTGDRIIRHFNEQGEILFSNEGMFKFRTV